MWSQGFLAGLFGLFINSTSGSMLDSSAIYQFQPPSQTPSSYRSGAFVITTPTVVQTVRLASGLSEARVVQTVRLEWLFDAASTCYFNGDGHADSFTGTALIGLHT